VCPIREFAKAVVAICAVALIVVTGMNHGIDGDMARVGMLVIAAIALGADALTEWLETRGRGQ